MPAGTGVWVVKTLLTRVASSASSNVELLALDEQPDALDREESRVAFVHVEDGGLVAERLKRAHAADAEHDLLANARIVIAAVKLAGDGAVFRTHVQRRVGIEEQHLDAADVHGPDADRHAARRAAAR